MSFTYDFTGENSAVAHLRLMIQDTVAATAFLQDEEITAILGTETNGYRAAAYACRIIAARLARQAGFKNATIIYDPTEKAKEYRALADAFDERAETGLATNLVLPQNFNEITDEYGNARRPSFTRNLHFTDRSFET